MELIGANLEFRGLIPKENKDGDTYYNVALEDETTEQLTLYLGKDKSKFKEIPKGQKIDVLFDYDTKYKNLRIVGVSLAK